MIGVSKKVFNYDLHLYQKGEQSKIDYAVSIINELAKSEGNSYILCDSWYSSKKLFKASKEQKYHVIAAIKSNRIICPNNNKISISNYGKL